MYINYIKMAEIIRNSRKGRKRKLRMFHGNSMYLDPASKINMNLVLRFLQKKHQEAKKRGGRNPRYSLYRLSKNVEKGPREVQYAVFVLTMMGRLKIRAHVDWNKRLQIARTATMVSYIPPDKRKMK